MYFHFNISILNKRKRRTPAKILGVFQEMIERRLVSQISVIANTNAKTGSFIISFLDRGWCCPQ